ncbi:hypothetical protein HRR83_000309 [Exophiala dermatitidis]|uniref:Thioredoxin domain-containing protein n=1 Tax=Exophiala dermatitidis TaxID=5970 RepID=A0AAN6F4N4_EXODE|nr:hypothetical protein HRR73_002845 [Exophiala dermatitidis]KAJ4524685.1 hypothetical protein HRR75_000275 [Exophiala dermatitidis]KAJ4527557.1 hypothetical protein HRR74_000311 [Exophiala dermatitidis]KAJ4531131.1 hypothetical protein HRR76_008807 [Exophiala dermatitidis]KAJ4549996.1 hypothetical protein HRR78_004807 [Exophiala dermatitidis]
MKQPATVLGFVRSVSVSKGAKAGQLESSTTRLTISYRYRYQHHHHHHQRQRPFSTTTSFQQQQQTRNRIFDPFRNPPQFHDALRLCSANNSLLLALFTTSACTPCRTITPLLTSLVETRPASPEDKFSGLAFAEVELDSPDTSNGSMMDLGIEYGVTSMPTLMGFGGRRAQRVTDRLVDTRLMSNPTALAAWVDEQMRKGDPYATGGSGSGGGGGSGGLLGRIFG